MRALDADQRAAVEAAGPVARVLGGPGSGKTTVATHVVAARVAAGAAADSCLLIASSRVGAARLRADVTAMLGATTTEPLARTLPAFAFGVLRSAAVLAGAPLPRLLSGPEQDVILGELLLGHAAGAASAPDWPDDLREALPTRGFRGELRDLLMRAVEHGLDPDDLADLGRRHDMPAWVAAAAVLTEYDEVTALSRPGAYDPAWILGAAADLLTDDADARERLRAGLGLLVVDDAHELTAAGARLVEVVAGIGVDVVVIGDPDAAVQTFRGADPRFIAGRWPLLEGASTHVLGTRWRQPAALAAVSARVTEHIGSLGEVRHRRQTPPARERSRWSGASLRAAGAADGARSRVAGAGGDAAGAGERDAGGGLNVVGDRGADVASEVRLAAGGDVEPAGFEGDSATEGAQGVWLADRGEVEVAVVDSPAQEAQLIATRLRRLHLHEGLPWSQMAVIVRGASRSAALRRALAGAGVPVTVPGAQVPLRDEPAVRPLLTMLARVLQCASGASRDLAGCLDIDVVLNLLHSPVGGVDALGARRLRRTLRRRELESGGLRSSDELLVAAAAGELALDGLGPAVGPLARVARSLAAGLEAAQVDDDGRWAPGVTCESVLWAMWDATGLAHGWRRTALAGDTAGARADRDLDAVVALFDAAARYVERLPMRGPDGFLDHIVGQEVAADTLVAGAPRQDCVTLTTPAGAAGREWPVVVVAGVQEGVWPDLRLRGSLLGSEKLLDVLAGRATSLAGAQRSVRHDELRLFRLAVSRARRRLIVTAVRSQDESPSMFLDLVDPPAGAHDERELTSVAHPMTLPGVVGELRRRAAFATDPDERRHAADRLALLATAAVPGADPEQWWGVREVTDASPRRPAHAQVPVSPSRVEAFLQCELKWLLTSSGGESGHPVGAMAVGTLVHEVAAEVDNGDEAALHAELERRWPELGLADGWLARRTFDQAATMLSRLARYDAQSRSDGWELVGKELDARVSVGRADVRGRVDRLERDEQGRLRVVDLKTGSSKPKAADLAHLPQLGAYQVAIEHGAFAEGSESGGAALLQVGKAAGVKVSVQEQPALATDDDPAWAERLVGEVAERMAGAEFVARPGDWCRMCPALICCPAKAEGGSL